MKNKENKKEIKSKKRSDSRDRQFGMKYKSDRLFPQGCGCDINDNDMIAKFVKMWSTNIATVSIINEKWFYIEHLALSLGESNPRDV